MKNALLKNSMSGVFQFVITAGLTFIGIAIFLNKLGSVAYGVFATVSIVGSLNVLVNFGLDLSLIKFIAKQGKTKESNYDIIITFFSLFILLIIATIIILLFKDFILNRILDIPLDFLDNASTLFVFLLFSNFILILGKVFGAILSALQKIHILNYLQLFYSFLYWGLIIITLLFGYRLKEIGYVIFLSTIIWFVMIIFYSINNWGGLPSFIGISSNYKRILKKQVNYGFKIYISGLLTFFFEPFTKILIVHFIGIKEVGFYEIALKFRSQIISILSKAMLPIFPLVSQLSDVKKIRLLIHDITQKSIFISIPLIIITISCTNSFVELWLGNDVDIISNSIISIAGIYLLTVTSTPNFQYLMAKDKVEKTIYIQLLSIILNVSIIIILYKHLGFYSVIIGNVFAIFSAFLLNIYYQYKYLGSLIFDSKRQFINLISSFFIIGITSYLLLILINNDFHVILILPLSIICITILVYRQFRIINLNDVKRYLGSNGKLAKFITVLLIKE